MRQALHWGVDSAEPATPELYNCVVENYGKPQFWGRYLRTIPGMSTGITFTEVSFLHAKGVKILPIYNNFKHAVGYSSGQTSARDAIRLAQSRGIPKNTVIFANIEAFFEVNAGWIRGWVDTVYPSGYRPGMYVNPSHGGFNAAYCAAAADDNRIKNQAILWSSAPLLGITAAAKAPFFAPTAPKCESHVLAWQYGQSAPACAIDTNLIKGDLFAHLW